jgi:hypothetical protein
LRNDFGDGRGERFLGGSIEIARVQFQAACEDTFRGTRRSLASASLAPAAPAS